MRSVQHRLTNLHTQSPVGDAVSGILGSTALLDTVCHRGGVGWSFEGS